MVAIALKDNFQKKFSLHIHSIFEKNNTDFFSDLSPNVYYENDIIQIKPNIERDPAAAK